jgi:hypothetical protein
MVIGRRVADEEMIRGAFRIESRQRNQPRSLLLIE